MPLSARPSLLAANGSAADQKNSWEWHVHADAEAMSRAVAQRLAAEICRRRDALVCLASGSSPQRTYELVAAHANADPALYTQARWLKLDEWGGIAMDDPGSCETFLRRLLIAPLRVPLDRYFGWNSHPADPRSECRRVAEWLTLNGPIDIAILGLGENGHLGFNEPASELQSGPHVAELSRSTLAHAMLGNSRARPTYGLTLGMDDILHTRRILLLVSGERKSRQLHRLVCGPISADFPGSLLRRCAHVSLFCDAAAASMLPADKIRHPSVDRNIE